MSHAIQPDLGLPDIRPVAGNFAVALYRAPGCPGEITGFAVRLGSGGPLLRFRWRRPRRYEAWTPLALAAFGDTEIANVHLDDVELGLATPMQMLRALLAGEGGHEEFLLLALRPPRRLPSKALRTRLRCLDQPVLTAAFVRIAASMSRVRERVLFDEALQGSLKLLLRRWTETNAKLTPGTAARKFVRQFGALPPRLPEPSSETRI